LIGQPIESTYDWLKYDPTQQTIRGTPTYIDALTMTNRKTELRLRAVDITGKLKERKTQYLS